MYVFFVFFFISINVCGVCTFLGLLVIVLSSVYIWTNVWIMDLTFGFGNVTRFWLPCLKLCTSASLHSLCPVLVFLTVIQNLSPFSPFPILVLPSSFYPLLALPFLLNILSLLKVFQSIFFFFPFRYSPSPTFFPCNFSSEYIFWSFSYGMFCSYSYTYSTC